MADGKNCRRLERNLAEQWRCVYMSKEPIKSNSTGAEAEGIKLLLMQLGLEHHAQEPLPPILLKIPDVARLLNITTARAYSLARTGILPPVSLGRQRRVSVAALEQFIASGGKPLPSD
jgi:hypothetical protein